MKLRYFLALAAVALAASFASAENWFMSIATPNAKFTNDDVTVTYLLEKTTVDRGTIGNANCQQPTIVAKVQNNTDDFIYIDLSKTYILRNGESELYQNFVTMSTSKDEKDEDGVKKSMAQTVMPIPPHASKSFKFPLFDSQGGKSGYEPFIKGYYNYYAKVNNYGSTLYRCENLDTDCGEPLNFTLDDSPVVATTSIAYSISEDTQKPTRITNQFYVDTAIPLKDSKDRTLEKYGIDTSDEQYFIIWAQFQRAMQYKKAHKNKGKKDKGKKSEKSGRGGMGLGNTLGGLVGQ